MNNFNIDQKLIFTIDLDAFFAQAEEMRNPELKGKAMGVGHELNGRGIVATANYKARSYGITSGMPLFKARELCSDFILVESDHEYYQEKANEVFEVISRYSDKIEFASIDECYVDLTKLTKKYKPLQIAKMIFSDVLKDTGLTVSIGISTNILLSKIASNFNKPKGISTLFKHEIPLKLWTLDIRELYMVGAKTEEKFKQEGINTIGDLAKLKDEQEKYFRLKKLFGIILDQHIVASNGNSTDRVNNKELLLKSINKNKTFNNDIADYEMIVKEARELFDFALYRAKKRQLMPTSISIALKKKKNFNSTSRSKVLKTPTINSDVLWPIVLEAIESLYEDGEFYKYCSVSLNNLKELSKTYKQLEIGEEFNKPEKDRLNSLAEEATFLFKTDVIKGTKMNDNRYYENKKPIDRDNIKFKSWEK